MTTYYNYLGQPMAVSANPTTWVNGSSSGHQTLTAPPGPSAVNVNGGNYDTLIASQGDNIFYVNNITDVVQAAAGLSGIKTIVSYAGGYTLPANVHNLTFYGAGQWGAGNSLDNLIIMGGNDQNTMDGGPGNDVLVGGFGENDFQFEVGGGHDVFYNFHPGLDTVRIAGAGFTSFAQIQSAMQQVGADVVLTIDANDSITFRDMTIAQFQPRNFLLPLDRSQLGPLTFDDEFNSLQLWNPSTGQGHWQTNFGGDLTKLDAYAITSNDEKQLYTAPNFKGEGGWDLSAYNPFSIESGGVLDITAGKFSYADSQHTWGQAYYSGMLNTRGLFMQKYGYFEIRAQLPTDLGSWPAFWLAQDPYKPGVEADVLEHLALYPDVNFARSDDAGTVTGHTTYMPSLSGFHTYGMLWGPTNTTFYIDDLAVLQVATPASWDQPMYMILDMALGGWGGTIDESGLPAQMKVDYVRIYGLASTSTPSPQPDPPPGGTSNLPPGPAPDPPLGTFNPHAAPADYDGDGASDIAFRNPTTGQWGFMAASATGGQVWHAVGPTSTDYAAIGFGDFNGDGLADIAFRQTSTGHWGFMTATGSGGQIWHDVGPTSLDYAVIGTGDFNGDGLADIAFRQTSTGHWGFMTANPSGGETWRDVGPTSLDYTAVGVGDFDGDGRADIAFRNNSTGDLGFMSFNPDGGEIWHPVGPTSPDYEAIGVGDFNGDHILDIAFRQKTTGDWGYMSILPSGGEVWHPVGPTSIAYTAIQTGDFNHDGLSDIAFRNMTTGDLGFMSVNPAGGEIWHPMGSTSTDYFSV